MADPHQDSANTNSDHVSVSNSRERQDDWAQKIRDQIASRRAVDVEQTLLEHSDVLEARFDYRFEGDFGNTEGLTPLILAAGLGCYTITSLLLAQGANVLAEATSGNSTAAHLAAEFGFSEVVKLLFQKAGTALLEMKDTLGRTALVVAAQHGDCSTVQFLIAKGANCMATDNSENTSFLLACLQGHLEIARTLLTAECNLLNHQNGAGRTALMGAVLGGNLQIVEFLLEKSADVAITDEAGDSVFHLACSKDDPEFAKTVLKKDHNLLNQQNKLGTTALIAASSEGILQIVKLLLENSADITIKDGLGDSAFHRACAQGHLEISKALLNEDYNILNQQMGAGRTALMAASSMGNLQIVEFLLGNSADVTIKDRVGSLAFHHACAQGHFEIAKALLKEDYNLLNQQTRAGVTALMAACSVGNLQIVEFLLEKSADITFKDDDECSAFYHACCGGHLSIVQKLLDLEPGLLEEVNGFRRTGLLGAAFEGRIDVVRDLLQRPVDTLARDKDGFSALHLASYAAHFEVVKALLEKQPDLLETIAVLGQTALLTAASAGHVDTVKYLISQGANYEQQDVNKNTALHIASRGGKFDVVEALLTDRLAIIDMRNQFQETPLLLAAINAHHDVVDLLMKLGANIEVQDEDGSNLFHHSAHNGNLDLIKTLLRLDESFVDTRNNLSQSALFIAAANGKKNVVDYLLEKKVDTEFSDVRGSTLIHFAAAGGLLELVEDLLEKQPELLDKPNNANETAILFATMYGNFDVVESLLKKNANTKVQNTSGCTMLYHACGNNASVELVQKLLDEGADPTATSIHGRNALHSASYNGQTRFVGILLEWLSKHSRVNAIVAQDSEHDTPLTDAVAENHSTVVFKLLGSPAYFPTQPSQDDVYLSYPKEKCEISKWLTTWIKRNWHEQIQEHRGKITNWAILNQDQGLLQLVLDNGGLAKFHGHDGATWAHVAALGNNREMIEQRLEWPNCMLDETIKKVTPLHLAVKQGHHSMVLDILDSLEKEDPKKALQAIIQETEDKQTLLSITEAGRDHPCDKISEDPLWCRLLKKDIFTSHNWDADRIMEQAAKSYTRGEMRPLEGLLLLMQEIHGKPDEKPASVTGQWSTLQLVVYYQFPLALWCLLSSGGYFGESHINEGQEMVGKWPKSRSNITKVIEKLLENPPPVQPPPRRSAPKDLKEFCDRGCPPNLDSQDSQKDSQKGVILDIFTTQHHEIAFQLKRSEMVEIIYKKGPDQIMKETGYSSVQILKDEIKHPEAASESNDDRQNLKDGPRIGFRPQTTIDQGEVPRHVASTSGETDNKIKSFKDTPQAGVTATYSKKYRWIHIPVNNLALVVKLMDRLSIDNNAHYEHGLAEFVKRSWSELPVGGGRRCMRPHCVNERAPGTNIIPTQDRDVKINPDELPNSAVKGFGKLALYMPYLSWSRREVLKSGSNINRHPGLNASANGINQHQKPIIHESLSLDQYYYVCLQEAELQERNGDQVLSRFLENRAREQDNQNFPENRGQLSRKRGKEDQNTKVNVVQQAAATQILVVNQLWLWILDDNTIITSTTQEDIGAKETFLQQVLINIRAQKGVSKLSVSHIAELIIGTATTSFHSPNIKIDGSGKEKRSPLEIFRESLQQVRNKESKLFENFKDSLISPGLNPLPKPRRSSNAQSQPKTKSSSKSKESFNPPTRPRRWYDRLLLRRENMKDSPIANDLQNESQGCIEHESWKNNLSLVKLRNWWTELKQQTPENRYENIHGETELLKEVKDILDELKMLKDLAKDQEHINGIWKKIAKVDVNRPFSIEETNSELQNMIRDAQSVQSAIYTLLDLKQKEATILEAQATRRQSDTVMVFTVVTIVFLPATFLTSFFALNVSEFPHQGDEVVFQGRWIFPIIFGSSLLFSTSFIFLAFNANFLKQISFPRGKQTENNNNDVVKTEMFHLQELEDKLAEKEENDKAMDPGNYRWV